MLKVKVIWKSFKEKAGIFTDPYCTSRSKDNTGTNIGKNIY